MLNVDALFMLSTATDNKFNSSRSEGFPLAGTTGA